MSKGFKSFFITFILSCVIFAYAASHIFNTYVDTFIESLFGIAQSEQSNVSEDFSQTISRPDDSDTSTSDESVDPDFKGASKGSLFILQNELGEVDTVMIMRRKLETNSLMITVIPADTRLYVDGAYQKIRNLLKNRDLEFFKSKMEAIVGVSIDYYFMMHPEDIEAVFTELDGYNYDVPYDMYLEKLPDESIGDESGNIIVDESTDEQFDVSDIITETPQDPFLPDESSPMEESNSNILVDLKAGNVKLDPNIFRQLMTYRRYDSEKEHMLLMKDVFVSLWVQMFSESNAEELRKDLELILPVLDTNYTMEEYDANVDAILGYSAYTKNVIEYPGAFKTMADGSLQFNAEIEKAILLFKDYR